MLVASAKNLRKECEWRAPAGSFSANTTSKIT